MGVSTNGILFYGVAYDEGTELPWDEQYDCDPEKWYAAKMGAPEPPEPYEEHEAEYEEHWKKKRELMANSGVEVGSYCSGEYPMAYIAVKGTEVTAWRGEAVPIDMKKLEQAITPEAMAKFRSFIELAGLEWQEPQWLLVSYWG